MFSFAVGPYVVRCEAHGVPSSFERWKREAALVVEEPAENLCCVCVQRDEVLILVVTQECVPGSEAGFHPGIALIPETNLLFVGAGNAVQAFDLAAPRRLWRDQVDMGFLGWARHGDAVVMSAELQLAAWDTSGRKLWTTFVEPPWSYRVVAANVELDVMGKRSSFPLMTGPW